MMDENGSGSLASWLFGNRAGSLAHRWALVTLRLTVGVIFIAHGAQKAFGAFGGPGFGGTVKMLTDLSFPVPEVFAVMLTLAELVGGVLLVLGLLPRIAAVAIFIVMAVALLKVHWTEGFFKTHEQQMIAAACVTIFIAGGGALSLQPSRPRSVEAEREEE
jgi:putative oxidoreductase